MATHFHQLTIKEVVRETSDCISICFDIPEALQSVFKYKEGQNIAIKKTIYGTEIRRSYSICNAPNENQLKVAIKKVEGGLFSTFANDSLKKNDVLEVMPPSGKFNAHLTTDKAGNYLAIAAGSGITPILSIIKHSLYTQADCKFTLIYGNRNRNSIIFFEELESIKNKYMERFSLINILSREKMDADIFFGRVDHQKLASLQKIVDFSAIDAAYLCGPESMIFSSTDFLQMMGLDKSKIHFELFTSVNSFAKQQKIETADSNSGPKSSITIKLDGRSFMFDLNYNGNSILDEALKHGADLPFACKGGVCCTCRAKLLEGNVEMDVNYALEEEELAQGFILTCQSHPTTSKVVIDFDEK